MPSIKRVTVGVTAVQLLVANGNRKAYTIVNRGTGNVFLGESSALTTTTDSFQVEPGQAFSAEDDPSDEIWAIASVAGQDVQIAEILVV